MDGCPLVPHPAFPPPVGLFPRLALSEATETNQRMTPRPFYRWKSFWLGLFVLVFLGWAWWDSYRNEALLLRERRDDFLQCLRVDGATYFVSGRWSFPSPLERFAATHSKGLGIASWNQTWQVLGASPVRVPDSLVFFSFVGLWGGWLVWRARVERKASLASR
jgi:hypothetical protein